MRLLSLVVLAFLAGPAFAQSMPAWAQPDDPGVDPVVMPGPDPTMASPDAPPPVPNLVPIDGGLGLLALAGGAYAAARLRRRED